MEILFIALSVIQVVAIAMYAYAIKKRIQLRYENMKNINHIRHQEKMIAIETINRSLLVRETLQPKPMKPNNWDSVKSCFQSPSRIEVNERS